MIGQIPLRRQPRPGQRRWLIIGAAVFVLFIFAGSVIRFYTDVLWFREIDLSQVFRVTVATKLFVGLIAGITAAIFVAINLEVTHRFAGLGAIRMTGGPGDQYRALIQRRGRLFNVIVATIVGVLVGLSSSAFWETFLLWRNGQSFGKTDPQFHKDIGFFMFHLPFQRAVLSWALGILILTTLISLGAHLLHGSIDPQGPRGRPSVRPVVKVHLSVLLGFIWLLKAWGYKLQSYELVYSPRGTVNGASYTDIHAQLPALRLLTFIAVVSALIFFANGVRRFRSWLLPIAALGLWAFASLALGAIYPAAVQRFQVQPNESELEQPFIKRNIEGTREAFGLNKVALSEFPAKNNLNQTVLDDNQDTLDNMRVWDPAPLLDGYKQLQALRQYYEFNDVDIDRYVVDGKLTQTLLAARELNTDKLDARSQTWVNQKLSFTHGYGLVGSPANAVTPEGRPELLLRDLPVQGPKELVPTQPAIYYGENLPGYVVAGSKKPEVDHPVGLEIKTSSYKGKGGIAMSSTLRRLAFAVRFGDTNLVISENVTPDSKLIMRRDILERVSTAAPFLRYDHDPYVVSSNGRMYWILDGYTASDRYPNSQDIDLGTLVPQQGVVNYMRNSVKVVIDAYDGTMDFYVVGPRDPIIATYQSIFPDMFKPGDTMPVDLQAHLRYPEDLFVVQTHQYGLYHMTNPGQFYQREDVWEIPRDPVTSTTEAPVPMEPYYVVMKLPGAEKAEFILMQPFTPANQPVLNGWVAARSDPGHYGELVGFSFPKGNSIEGPVSVSARVNQDPVISAQKSLWDRSGSSVLEGNLFVIPIGESLIYVQPLYLRASKGAIPELEKVIVFYGDRLGFESTFEGSLAKALSGEQSAVDPGGGGKPKPPASSGDTTELLTQALSHFQAADTALRNGDLAAYQRETQAAKDAIEQAQRTQAASKPG